MVLTSFLKWLTVKTSLSISNQSRGCTRNQAIPERIYPLGRPPTTQSHLFLPHSAHTSASAFQSRRQVRSTNLLRLFSPRPKGRTIMSHTNGKGNVSVDVIEAPDETRSFYDSTNPTLAAPKAEPKSSKGWKRKLIGWSFVLLLIVGGGFALYVLLRANRVNVKVQADSRRETNSEKPQPSPGGSGDVLGAEV